MSSYSSNNSNRQVVVPRNKKTTFAVSSPVSTSAAADRRGRLSREDADDLVNTVKAFTGKTSETVDKYEEARKKSKINRFFKGVRGVFPKRKNKDKGDGKGRGKKRSDDASSSSGASSEDDEKSASRYTKQERKDREIGGGKFQEKERRKREEEERKRQAELEARRRQRKGSAAGYPDEDEDEDDAPGKRSDGSDEDDERRLEDKRQMKKQKQLLLKRAQSTPAAAPLDKEAKPQGIREKYRAKLEAKKAVALAEMQREEEEKEQEKQRQVAKAEEAAIDSFLERAAQRRRGTQERVGFRSKRASVEKVEDKEDDSSESEDEDAALRRRLGLTTTTKKANSSSNKGKEKAEGRGKGDLERTASARPYKKVAPAKGRSEPQMSGSMSSIATNAAIGGAKLVGRYVQQRLDDSEDVERESDEEVEDDVEEERAHRWKDKERESKVKERIEETRRIRQAQEQGRRPSLGKSYSWASPRSGDIPVPMTSRDRMMAAVEGAAARNSPATAAHPSPRASPSSGGSGDRTLWHRKARVIRERSQRNLTGGASKTDMRTTSDRKLAA